MKGIPLEYGAISPAGEKPEAALSRKGGLSQSSANEGFIDVYPPSIGFRNKKLSLPFTNSAPSQSVFRQLLLLLGISLWWNVAASLPFWTEAISPELSLSQNLRFAFACGALLVFAHAALLAFFAAALPDKAFKAATVLLSILAAAGGTFAIRYHAAMTPEMLRNTFETDPREATELMSLSLVALFALLCLPAALISVKCWQPLKGLKSRVLLALAAPLLVTCGAAALFTDFSSAAIYMREHHDARYFLMPSAVVSSSVRTFVSDTAAKPTVRAVVDPHPVLLASRRSGKPVVVVTVVGETVRAANWGLSGYSRDTTPRLRELGVVNFPGMTSCGTDTATSVPCIFSRVGRRDYSRADILGEEPLPVLLQRAGVHSKWIDNQSGSKGAADGISDVTPKDLLSKDDFSKKCPGGVCPDGVLSELVGRELDAVHESSAFYLHMMGSHGPAYAARYPEEFNRWGPVCQNADLRQCDLKELRNAYDNTILYTDTVLADIIENLRAHEDLDTALIYFSDHGESLGENGFFLHGAPYAISPEHQTRVPMIMWFSDGFREHVGLDEKCLLQRAQKPASHDNLWSTIMGLNGVSSFTYMQDDDLLSPCISER